MLVAQESRPVAWLSLYGRDDDAVVLVGDSHTPVAARDGEAMTSVNGRRSTLWR
jgi:hypothetical protein